MSQAEESVRVAIENSVKAMGIDLWPPLTISECDLVRRALAPLGDPSQRHTDGTVATRSGQCRTRRNWTPEQWDRYHRSIGIED